MKLPDKKYQIIYADPPWKLDSNVPSRAFEKHYPTMDTSEIEQLTIPVAENAVLYLWATAPKLLDAISVMTSWGFKYKSHLIWDKEIIGCGWWFRGQHELLLVGVKGKYSPPTNADRISSVFREQRSRHSRKPPGIRVQISKWFPDVNKLELFARKESMLFDADGFDGWDVWGNEVESDIEL